ncbi:hypothetical protein BDZ89DRAFT_934710, partial [Hymenopellis radicata]
LKQYADIESLVLSGELFNGKERSSSPVRTPSPSSDNGWHDDELNDKRPSPVPEPQQESIGMGPGRTGVKGVIRDRNEAQDIQKQRHAQDMDELRQRMEKNSLTGKTYLEEEREKADRGEEKVDPLVQRERERVDVFGMAKQGRFGHLREVGAAGFVQAVERDDNGGAFVVVHLYDKSLDRCYTLDDSLTRLARLNPNTKFLRCRASALGFASTGPTSASKTVHRPPRTIHEDNEDDEDGHYDDKDNEDEESEEDENVDLDMLPTMLVYRTGELVHNWVRVDWEAGTAGIEELLEKHHILSRGKVGGGNLGLPSDDEDDE